MHIISNRLVYDDGGVALGFSEPLIHTFNKHHVTESFKEEFKETEVCGVYVCGRHCVECGRHCVECGRQQCICFVHTVFLNVHFTCAKYCAK